MEKTEKPTPYRLKKAREEGQTFSSNTFESFIKIFIIFVVLINLSPHFFKGFCEYIGSPTLFSKSGILPERLISIILYDSLYFIPILVVIPFIAIIVSVLYRPNLISSAVFRRGISRYFKNINIMHLFSKERFFKFLFTSLKLIFFVLLIAVFIKSSLFVVYNLNQDTDKIMLILHMIKRIILFSIIIGVVLGILDMAIERHRFLKSLYMTKQEVKEEFKNQEGDPEIKARQKRFRQMILFSDPKRDTQRAKFLLVNPTHIAIPVIYSEDEETPLIGYIGVDDKAREMINVAKVSSIPVVKNVSLAREFFKKYEPGDQIEEEHFEIVASILSIITALEGKIDYIDMDS